MTVYMPPIARKKRVQEQYKPDTFRVISETAEERCPKFDHSTYNEMFNSPPKRQSFDLPDIYNRETEVIPPRPLPDYRANRPHPGGCGFLRSNVALLNEPICTVHTSGTHSEQNQWWPSRTSNEPLNIPPFTKDTIYRDDFQFDKSRNPSGSQRYGANPNTEAALGAVPVNFLRSRDGNKRMYKEGLSYEHHYNCRSDPNYTIRGKRQGSFVWKQMSQETANKFVEYHSQLYQEEMKQKALEEALLQGLTEGHVPGIASPKSTGSKSHKHKRSVSAAGSLSTKISSGIGSRKGSMMPVEMATADTIVWPSAAPAGSGPHSPKRSGPGSLQRSGPGSPQRSGPGSPQRSGPGSPQKSVPGSPQQSGPGSHQISVPDSPPKLPVAKSAPPTSSQKDSEPQVVPVQSEQPAAVQDISLQAPPQTEPCEVRESMVLPPSAAVEVLPPSGLAADYTVQEQAVDDSVEN